MTLKTQSGHDIVVGNCYAYEDHKKVRVVYINEKIIYPIVVEVKEDGRVYHLSCCEDYFVNPIAEELSPNLSETRPTLEELLINWYENRL